MGHFERYEDSDTKQDRILPIPPVPAAVIWDIGNPGGPTKIELDLLSAREFMARDPARYVAQLPPGARQTGA